MPSHLEAALQAAIKARASKPPPARVRLPSTTVGDLTFCAAFDSGNLAHVECGDNGDHFIVHTRADAEGTAAKARARTWFHFSIRGAKAGRTLDIEVRNMNPQSKLYEHGMLPVFRSLPSQPEWSRVVQSAQGSIAVAGATLDTFSIRFSHTVTTSAPGETLFFAFCYPLSYSDLMARLAWTDGIFRQPAAALARGTPPSEDYQAALERLTRAAAAASIADGGEGGARGGGGGGGTASREAQAPPTPVSDEQIASFRRQRLVDACTKVALEAGIGLDGSGGTDDGTDEATRMALQLGAASARRAASLLPGEKPDNVYYRRELLTRSLEGRRIDLLTLTGTDGQQSSTEPSLPAPLLPEGGPRPHRFKNKRVVLVSARVHPGETPASHVVDGLLDFLLRWDDPRATALRARFVFKIVPMLNPDGVHHGHYRCDTNGVDLNRTYAEPSDELHPSSFALMAVLRRLHEEGSLAAYIDCHAHAGRRGCFFYGNGLDERSKRDEAALYARLVSLNTRWFDADSCTWFDGSAHQGSARAAAFAATGGGFPHIYTLECNYDSGVAANELQPRHTDGAAGAAGRLSPEPPKSAVLSPKYEPASWRDVGKALALAVLDMVDANPASRLGPPGGGALERLRDAIRTAPPKKIRGRKALLAERAGHEDDDDDDDHEED